MRRLALWVVLAGLSSLAAAAQSSPDIPGDQTIERDQTVVETITEVAFFDLWRFYGTAGEEYEVVMAGSGGLAPVVGVRAASGDVFASSDQLEDGTILLSEPDSEAILRFTVPFSGELVLIASRDGLDNGTTTGSYRLTLSLLAAAPEAPDPYTDVTFRCQSEVATSVAVVEFGDAGETAPELRLTVWASFPPVIRVGDGGGTDGSPTLCALPDPQDGVSDAPPIISGGNIPLGERSFSATGENMLAESASFSISPRDAQGSVTMTIGSLEPGLGVFVARIDGLQLEGIADSDVVVLRHGPFARDGVLRLAAQAEEGIRLDMQVTASEVEGVAACPDWGLRSCVLRDWREIDIAYGGEALTFDILDAVAEMATGEIEPVSFVLAGGNPNVEGRYTLWLFGALSAGNVP
ncbi:MAG: hypothetical protein MUF38_08640 [Anaerolineae bacterium]|nr:hypothetical protein [Anaerolineae bacterium]